MTFIINNEAVCDRYSSFFNAVSWLKYREWASNLPKKNQSRMVKKSIVISYNIFGSHDERRNCHFTKNTRSNWRKMGEDGNVTCFAVYTMSLSSKNDAITILKSLNINNKLTKSTILTTFSVISLILSVTPFRRGIHKIYGVEQLVDWNR